MTRVLFAAAFVIACAHVPPSRPMSDYQGLTEATALACTSVEMPGACPSIVVREGDELTCRNTPGTQMSGWGCVGTDHPGCVCTADAADSRQSVLPVAREPGQRWHETAICHGFVHMSQGRNTGNSLSLHEPPFYDIDSRCRDKLKTAGY